MQKLILLFLLMGLFSMEMVGQCPGCAVDTMCITQQPMGGICPDSIPAATVGVYYEQDVTFHMPLNTTDPGTGLAIDLLEIEITGVQGLPLSLQWECGNSPTNDCIFTPPSNPPASTLGCIRFCGTPIVAPGSYTVLVNFLADVYVPSLGASIDNQPANYEATLVVLPGVGGNNSFTFSPSNGCADLAIDFEAIIDFSPTQPTEYLWDFGNGITSTDKMPPTQTFGAGVHSVNLITTVNNYVLNEVCVSSVNDAWCGDAEEPTCNCGVPVIGVCPDIYAVVTDANSNAVYSADAVGGVTNACWNGLSIILDNPPYTISVYDDDLLSNDDLLGTFPLTISSTGTAAYSSSDGTIGNYTIGQAVSSTFNDTDTINVNPTPTMPSITYDWAGSVGVDNPAPTLTYQWFLDGVAIVGATGSSVSSADEGNGNYSVEVTNNFGCASMSSQLLVILSSVDDQAAKGWKSGKLYPNPTNGLTTLDLELYKATELQFTVLDPLGRKVWEDTRSFGTGSHYPQFDLSTLNRGVYLFQVHSSKGLFTKKLVVTD